MNLGLPTVRQRTDCQPMGCQAASSGIGHSRYRCNALPPTIGQAPAARASPPAFSQRTLIMHTQPRTLLLASSLALAIATASGGALAENMSQDITEARQESQISTAYSISPYLRASDLKVSVDNGKATLTGRVTEEANKELANEIALGVSGIDSVTNNIVVDAEFTPSKSSDERSFGDTIDDASTTAAIKSKLLWSRHAEGMDTKVVTRDGKVTLSGTVGSSEALEHAASLAMSTNGVTAVDNQLKVKADKPGMVDSSKQAASEAGDDIADSWITTKVKSTLLYSRNVGGTGIDVSTENGVVTLSGKVDDGAERALAVKLTENVRGVRSVQSKALTF